MAKRGRDESVGSYGDRPGKRHAGPQGGLLDLDDVHPVPHWVMPRTVAWHYTVELEKFAEEFQDPQLTEAINAIIKKLKPEELAHTPEEIFQQVKERSDGKILLKDGSLYPALQKMRKEGLLSCEEIYIGKRVRKYYVLTKKGKEKKASYVEELKDFIETLNKVIFPEFGTI